MGSSCSRTLYTTVLYDGLSALPEQEKIFTRRQGSCQLSNPPDRQNRERIIPHQVPIGDRDRVDIFPSTIPQCQFVVASPWPLDKLCHHTV